MSMRSLASLINDLNDLPKGYISVKTIHGIEYHYLQYKDNGVLKSKFIPESKLQEVVDGLQYRKTLEYEIANYKSSFKDLPTLSKRSKDLTGSLMMEDIPVATFEEGILTSIYEKKCPLYINRTHNLKGFLELRAIDQTRTNSRILKKALNIKESEDSHIALYAYGQTITDNYWFKTKGSKLKYKDISFTGDFYSDLALKGQIILYPDKPKLTPSITTRGSFEKCWKLENGEWWLYKRGSKNEIFSEIFISKLSTKLNIPSAYYEYHDGYIRTKNFADKYNFEPMVSIAEDNDDYEFIFNSLLEMNEEYAREYLKLIWLDSIVNNIDRHNENLGFLRDKKTGELISLAPNFDNNLALISRSDVLYLDSKDDGFIKSFIQLIKNNSKAKELYQDIKKIKLTPKIIEECFKETSVGIEADYKLIEDYLLNRYQTLLNIK